MAKTIPQYRQEKYDKYDSIDEGKLFYRHEKNLDLVNTVEEIVYILQEENPWMNPPIKREMLGIAYNFPNPIRSQIYKKIEKSYNNGIKGSLRNADYRLQKFVLKPLIYKNNPKELLWRELGYVDKDLENILSDDIGCFSHGGVSIFFFGQEDRQHITRINQLGQTRGFFYKNTIWMAIDGVSDKELVYNHEYQHYLFNNFLMNIPTKEKFNNIHYRIIDELCATLVHEDNNPNTIVDTLLSYIFHYCDVDDIQVESTVFHGSVIHQKIKVTKEGLEVKDIKQLKDIGTFIMLLPQYVKMACAFVDLFEKIPQLNMDKQKAIRILSMTSPHYRKDLLKYYTKLAQHMKQKSMTSSEQ